MKRAVLIIFCLTTLFHSIEAQMFRIPIQQQVENSVSIVEGEVINVRSFETENGDFIYTAYEIKVAKIFKGEMKEARLEIISPGGQVEDRIIKVDPSLELNIGDWGTFFLNQKVSARIPSKQKKLPTYRGYAGQQSVFLYSRLDRSVRSVFEKFDSIENSWYQTMENLTNQAFLKISKASFPEVTFSLTRSTSNFTLSPDTITGGTQSVLTITGTNFGDEQGAQKIFFSFNNTGGTTFIQPSPQHILSWSDTSIEVIVPSTACSGDVVLQKNVLQNIVLGSITVPYSEENLSFSNNTGAYIFQLQHPNVNGTGGFTFTQESDLIFFPLPIGGAQEAVSRAMDSWTCATNINFTKVTSPFNNVNMVEDNINILRLSDPDELPAGTAATKTIYLLSCANIISERIHIEEIDITFNRYLSWYTDMGTPSENQLDFETVAVKMFGFAHGLQSVCDDNKVMHFEINPGEVRRTLHPDDIAGGVDIHARNTDGINFCSQSPMTDFPHMITPLCKNITVELNVSGNYTLDASEIEDGSTIVCDDSPLNITIPPTTFDCSHIGVVQSVILTVSQQGNMSNTATCISNIDVVDNEAPVIQSVPDKSFPYNDNCAYVMPDFRDSVSLSDNCPGVFYTWEQFPMPGSIINGPSLQNISVFLTVTDEYGNVSDDEVFAITLFNSAQPVAICKDIEVYLDNTGSIGITFEDIDGGSFWSCGGADIFISNDVFDCFSLGQNAITLEISQGLIDQCTSVVTVIDSSAPVLNCPGQVELFVPFGTVEFNESELMMQATDNCFNFDVSFSPMTYACGNLPTSVSVMGEDLQGNESECVIALSYFDDTQPVALCKNFTVNLDQQGIANVLPSDVDNGSFDDCEIVEMTVSPNSFGCFQLNTLKNTTLTVTDAGGNTASCIAQVGILDNEFPNDRLVTNMNDTGPGSLRQVLNDACFNDIISFDPSLAGDTIIMDFMGPEINIVNDGKKLTVDGLGIHQTFIQSPTLASAFNIAFHAEITFKNMHFINQNIVALDGGGIRNEGGQINFENFIFTQNANLTGAIPLWNAMNGLINFNGQVKLEE